MKPTTAQKLTFRKAILVGLVILLLNACSFSLLDIPNLFPPTATPSYPFPPTPTPQPMAEETFNATLPEPLLPGETLVLSVVDEVTGLSLNPTNYTMQSLDALHYTISVPFAVFSVVKYRYIKQSGLPVMEDDPLDRPIRYRMAYVSGASAVTDSIASWTGVPFSGSVGRVVGTVKDAGGAPLTNILVNIGGEQTLTDSTGTFILDSVLPGASQNMVAYAMDGSYTTFQQGVVVGAGKRTPVTITMNAAPLVTVIFTVIVPSNTVASAPIRLAGNLLQLGNTFADLDGGMNTVAARMPTLGPLPDGRYALSMQLPAGADVRYKFTLGDGFWNAEHAADGSFVLRQLIVPQSDQPVLASDLVTTWQAGPSAPITFEVTAPGNTPVSDIVSIQFNPYGWTEPIPMWPLGSNRWVYKLYGPLNMLGAFEYRYCRNDQCGVADDATTPGNHAGRAVSTSLTSQDLQDEISSWRWMDAGSTSPLVGVNVKARTLFWAGLEFQAGYDPTWQPWMPIALQNVQGINANWVVLSPTWTYTRSVLPAFSPVPGSDPLWSDMADTIGRARAGSLSVALFPAAVFPEQAGLWWSSAARDTAWWNNWFDRYQAFAIYHADMAARDNAQALILGGEWVSPALPGGSLPNGGVSGVPADADVRWASIISAVRQHYSGPVFWALPYNGTQPVAPSFLNTLDGIYLLWNAPLSSSGTPSQTDLQARAGQLLDADIQPLSSSLQKPVIIGLASPSVTGTASACLPDGAGGCLPWAALNEPEADYPNLTVNLAAQSDVVLSMLAAINDRPWVGGFVSRGYYPPASLLDLSASVHGKPAADVLWYWYPRMLGGTP